MSLIQKTISFKKTNKRLVFLSYFLERKQTMRKTDLKILVGIFVLVLGTIGMNTKVSAQALCQDREESMMGENGTCWNNNRHANMASRNMVRQEKSNAVIEKLNLNEKQKEAWDNYQATIAAQLKAMQERKALNISAMPTLERIEKRKQFVKEDSNLMTDHLEALKTFYLTLTPEQQKILDTEIGLGKGFGHRHGYGNRQRQGRSRYQCDGTCD